MTLFDQLKVKRLEPRDDREIYEVTVKRFGQMMWGHVYVRDGRLDFANDFMRALAPNFNSTELDLLRGQIMIQT